MNTFVKNNYGDNYTLQAGATVVARSGLEEALARERNYDELDRQAHEILQKEFPDDEDIPDLPLTDITIDKSGCYGTFSLCYDTGDSPAGELYLNVSFDEQFVPSPKVGYDTF